MGGYVFGLLGRAPEPGDEVERRRRSASRCRLEGTRIERLEIEFLPQPEQRGAAEQRAAEA